MTTDLDILPGDQQHVIADALDTLRNLIAAGATPWEDYDADPATDPKASREGYAQVLELADEENRAALDHPPADAADRFYLGLFALGAVFCLVFGWLMGSLWLTLPQDDKRPMPCTESQVYVWADYNDEARCVSATDHEEHG